MLRTPLMTASAAVSTLTAVVLVPGTAHASPETRTVTIRSFDGVGIITHFFPAPGLRKNERRPVVLLGHGWGTRGDTDRTKGQLADLLGAGYNVVTWNSRGFGSGGASNVDDPRVEGRDILKIIDWTAKQSEVKLDRKGDPRMGMAGGSYGGAIQLIAAGLDRRVDVIAPMVTFNSLINSLYPDRIYRASWGLSLCLGGVINGNQLAPIVRDACVTGLAQGTLPPATERWFRAHGPDYLVKRIKIPTLIFQATVDTLFTLRQGIANYQTVKANGAPVKMVWTCEGHGICNDKQGPADHTAKTTLKWFARYLKNQKVDTGPGFEYLDQYGVYRTASAYPPPSKGKVRARGTGHLAFSRADIVPYLEGKNTTPVEGLPFPDYMLAAKPAKKAVNVPIHTRSGSRTVGVPKLTLHYKGVAKKPGTALFAQIVDQATGRVVGNQATPLPVILDGKSRTLTRDLEALSYTFTSHTRLKLQIIPITGLFDWQRSAGQVSLTADVTLPLA
ncbi:alpha/beta fold hydrolase [Actinomadura barringtoniae]|uniref:Alpha/beta fold hydrolase n=1 Tax=Actinomadura barringtoniae TaxID=1427535 RepID=A0A939PEK9_9ACTN|nr:alpha/beta fold hydrolase [Actinomadura barringtoniae]MBO2448698.1 alpha/beta fold hydrolase [Actinomadura barringtoniae]